MNLIKQFLNDENHKCNRIKVNNDTDTTIQCVIKSDLLFVVFTHLEQIKKGHSTYLTTTFYFNISTNFIDIFNDLTLEDLENYDLIKNLKKNNQEKIFLNHIEYMKDYQFCKEFIPQFDYNFLYSINNYTLPDIIKINILLFLSSFINIQSVYWIELKIISFFIIENKFCIKQFPNIQDNNILTTIFKYNLAENIIKFDNFTLFLNSLDEDIILVLLKESNRNFLHLENEDIKYKFLTSNNSHFKTKDQPNTYSIVLQHYFIYQLLNDNNRILESILDSEDKIFISHTFLSTVVFLNKLQHYIDTAHSFHQFYKLVELFNKYQNNYLIFNNLEYIKSTANNLAYLLYQHNFIDYDQLDNNLKLNIETIISEKQLQNF